MVHLNELHEKYASKGLVVLGVTNEARSAVDEFVEKNGPKYPLVIEKTDSIDLYDGSGFPTMVLIGPDGRILEQGPVSESRIEEALAGVRLMPEIPAALSAAGKALEKQKYADALSKLSKSLESGSLEEADAEAGRQLLDWITWYATSGLDGAAKDLGTGKVYEAWRAYEELADAFKGHALGNQAKEAAADILKDKDRKLEVKAGEKLEEIRAEIRDMSPKKALKALQPLLGKKYEATAAGKKAKELAEALEKEEAN